MNMRIKSRRLQNRELARQFERNGYVVVPALDQDRIAAAFEVYERYPSGIDAGYYASIHSTSQAYKESVDAELRRILWPPCDDLLFDHRCLVAALMVKPPTGQTVVPVHQDWNTIEERSGAGITCWVPLTPITSDEGLMRVLPGSHRYVDGLRGSPGFPAPYQEISKRIDAELMIDVPVAVGEVMVMDGRVLHTTGPNLSGRYRVAGYMNAIPRSAQPIHYYRHDDGSVEGFEVDLSFFTSFNIGERPTGTVYRTIDRYEQAPLTMEELLRRRRHDQRRFLRRAG